MQTFAWFFFSSLLLWQAELHAEPDIRFEERVYDFGEAYQGDLVTHIYGFENAGRSVLRIERVRASCRCTAAVLSKRRIPPWGRGEVKVRFDTEGREGEETHTVRIYSNDPDEPVVELEITGRLKANLVLEPELLSFGVVHRGESVKRKVRVLPGRRGRLRIVKIESSSPYIQAEITESPSRRSWLARVGRRMWERVSLGSGRQGTGRAEEDEVYEVTVTLCPDAPLGQLGESLKIYTKYDDKSPATLHIFGRVAGEVAWEPDHILIEPHERDSSIARKIRVSKSGEANLRILRVETGSNRASSKILTVKEGREYEVEVKALRGIPAGAVITIRIHTNHPEYPVIQVPIHSRP